MASQVAELTVTIKAEYAVAALKVILDCCQNRDPKTTNLDRVTFIANVAKETLAKAELKTR